MININIVAVGLLKEDFWKDAQSEYQKRLSKFCKLNIIQLQDQTKYDEEGKILAEEEKLIEKNLQGKVYLLEINAKMFSSEEFAYEIEKTSQTNSTITFVVGGSYGVSQGIKEKIKDKISFGKITLPHNLARVVLLEQIYRAFMILSGAKYHK